MFTWKDGRQNGVCVCVCVLIAAEYNTQKHLNQKINVRLQAKPNAGQFL